MAPALTIRPRAGYAEQTVNATESPSVEGFLLYHYKDEYNGNEIFTCRQGENGIQHGTRVTVTAPRVRSWNGPVPARVMPEFYSSMDSRDIRLMAELLIWAAEFADKANEDIEAQAEKERAEAAERERQRQEEQRKAREERERQAREEAERRAALEAPTRAWRQETCETLQWHIGGWFRLLRWNMRATVFGTLEHVEAPHYNDDGSHNNYGRRHHTGGFIELTTEKGKYMRLTFEELERVQLRDDDERDYTEIPLPDHPEYDSPVRRERREISGGMGASRKDRLVTGE